ncbi:diguanylate cyclase [Pseudoalteromonas distincta]|uniref:tetratricopeptide repeat-containing diguanylate cyclase n=1 Tax=Pseudoalteromonas distincta TaxID=77608 RepID=UPI00020A0960|nr:diguanylate cyclase [Pseudoalteromonas distincta]EGI71217.1 diguanylate cyclase [Pseudoalteromonas distincta]
MDLPSQIHSFIVKRIYNFTFLVKALLFALFVSLNSAYAQETTSYSLTNESNTGLLKRAELLIDTDVITSIELSKSLLSQAQSADDMLLSAKLHNLLGRANKKNNNINASLEHFLQSSVYYSKLNDSRNQIKASINYINILLEEKRYDELTTRIETLLPTALVYGDDFFIAQVLLTKGDSFYEQKKYDNANAQYTSALKYLVDEDELIQRQLGETYKKLAQSYKRLKNREQTAHFYTKALEIYTSLGDLKLMARTLNTLAEAHRYLDNLVLALDYSTRALEIHKDIDDPVGFAKALLGAGIIYRHINLYEKSLEHINEAYLYYKKVNNMLGIAKTSNQMGLVYTRLRQFDQAEFFYQITIDLPKGMVEEKTLASALREMAVINLESGDLASAMQYAKKAYITYKNKNLTSYISTTARIIGNIYRAQGNNNKAIEYYKESLSFARETGGKLYEIKSLTALAGILIGIDTNEAISLLKRSLALSTEIDDKLHMLYAYREIRIAEKLRGRIEESLRYAEEEIALTDIIQNERNEDKLALEKAHLHSHKMEIELETLREKEKRHQLELEKKNNQIEIAAQARVISELELSKNKYASIALAFLLAACLAIVLLVYRSFIASKKRNEELDYLAARDPLTNCYNRRILFEVMNRDFLDLPQIEEYCILMVDIDHFKSVNDTYGHSIGDTVLCGVAELLQANIRKSDSVARFGGEEFCIILPNTTQEQAIRIAEAIRIKVEKATFDDIPVTCSFGVTSIKFKARTPSELIEQADLALYEAKSLGRNQVALWDASLEEFKLFRSE